MRTIMISGAALLLSTAAFPAAAAPAANVVAVVQATTQYDQATEQPRARDNSRRVCVNEEMSNSRLSRRVCRTQAEWDEMRRTGELIERR
jgi:hypothetical protein